MDQGAVETEQLLQLLAQLERLRTEARTLMTWIPLLPKLILKVHKCLPTLRRPYGTGPVLWGRGPSFGDGGTAERNAASCRGILPRLLGHYFQASLRGGETTMQKSESLTKRR